MKKFHDTLHAITGKTRGKERRIQQIELYTNSMGWNLYNLPTGNIQLKQECTSPRTAEILRGIIITVQHIIGQYINRKLETPLIRNSKEHLNC